MSSKPLVVLICVFACVVGSWSAEKKASLYNRAVESSVEMLVDGRIAGTGVIVDGNGTILTACHVIRTGERYEARSATFEQTPIKLICTDRSHDLALLSLPPRDKPYPFMKLANKVPAEGRPVHLQRPGHPEWWRWWWISDFRPGQPASRKPPTGTW